MKFEDFAKQVRAAGLEPADRGNGHWQIRGGALLVNFYPHAKRRPTFYVAGTTSKRSGGIADAIAATKTPPPLAVIRDKRRQQTATKRRLWLKNPHCHWCKRKLEKDEATVDHVIPLARGGLDNHNNKVLACGNCNQARGHEMPEVKTRETA